MQKLSALSLIALIVCAVSTQSQRITTIQLDGVQYFVSRMNPYSPELNYFLAYQYCRSLGLQLASFETKEKADSITQYLSNAGYNKYDFWTSGNKLGTDMFLWMSTGLPFNATFNYMKKTADAVDMSQDIPSGSTSPQRTARESDSGASNGCVTLRAPTFEWDTDDCMTIKDFICEQTRCYYYNYGSIPVSSAQGKLTLTTTTYKPPTSPPSYHSGEFPSELRSSTRAPSNKLKIDGDDVKDDSAVLPDETMNVESTNGPYDSFHGIEIHREPASFVDQQHDVDYVSTIEPETVTIYERSFKPVI